jgi:branched-chain amino acid transport system ATP-binding protein
VADRVYLMDKGKLVHEGPAPALLKDTALRTRLLGV